MKGILLSAALLITASNLAVAIAYADKCEGPSGGRVCGEKCSKLPNGECACEGTCTKEEMKWVSGELLAE